MAKRGISESTQPYLVL